MQQENRDLASLIGTLNEKLSSAPASDADALGEIRQTTSALHQTVRSIADTLSALSREE